MTHPRDRVLVRHAARSSRVVGPTVEHLVDQVVPGSELRHFLAGGPAYLPSVAALL